MGIAGIGLAGQRNIALEPRFGQGRDQRIDRHLALTETPAFQQEFRQVLARARQYLAACQARGERDFVVFDIDETVLDNRGYFRDPGRQFYKRARGRDAIRATWEKWVRGPTSRLFPPPGS